MTAARTTCGECVDKAMSSVRPDKHDREAWVVDRRRVESPKPAKPKASND